MTIFSQRPNEKPDYYVQVSGDTIAAALWTITPGGALTSQLNESTKSTIRVSGLLSGLDYELICHITGASGRELEAVAKIEVRS